MNKLFLMLCISLSSVPIGCSQEHSDNQHANFNEAKEHDPHPLSKDEERYMKIVRKTRKKDVWKMTKDYFVKNHPKLAKQIAGCVK